MNPGAAGDSSRIKSPVFPLALTPAKVRITFPQGTSRRIRFRFSRTKESPSGVLSIPSGLSISRESGPRSRFPWTVGTASTPFPRTPGTG